MSAHSGRRTGAHIIALGIAFVLVTGCGSVAAGHAKPSSSDVFASVTASRSQVPQPTNGALAARSSQPGQTGLVPPTLRLPPATFKWSRAVATSALDVATVDGGAVSLLWMDPARLRFRYVPGLSIPENGPSRAADSTPATWLSRLVAAFNGGFKLSNHLGGYYYLGTTVVPLRAGYAAVTIHADGSLAVGVWGRDMAIGPDVVVVRQELPPLVERGVSRASRNDDPDKWGSANGGLSTANRSALGELADGSLIFEYGASVTGDTMARYLVKAGAVTAMVMDMNVSWPTGFVYHHVGARILGSKINSHIVRPPSTYFQRFKKDFIAVQAIQ